jgi:hypothetical protein
MRLYSSGIYSNAVNEGNEDENEFKAKEVNEVEASRDRATRHRRRDPPINNFLPSYTPTPLKRIGFFCFPIKHSTHTSF